MIAVPEEYTIAQFYQYSHQPKHNRYNNTYQAGCIICREGDSLGRKRRCYYIPKKDIIFCHNCGWSSKPFKWIKEVSGKTTADIISDIKNYTEDSSYEIKDEIPVKKIITTVLPQDSINLFDEYQLNYYSHSPIVKECMSLIKSRRLDTAINRPDKLFVSLTDKTHKNRLVIPFINEFKDIEFYQTRTVLSKDIGEKAKYISRIGSEKTLFNIDKVTPDHNNVYIFEGPLNAFFTKNSVAVAGITDRGVATFTTRQQEQIDTVLKWYNKIWVLDSQWLDNASLKKTEILLNAGHTMFIWPEKFGRRFKDFNDICVACKIDEISPEFIQKNSFSGIEGIFKIAEIKRYRSNQT